LRHGLTAHLDATGIVHQAIEDAIGDAGITDLRVPARDRQLKGEDGGAIFALWFARVVGRS
jgi:hypothetical protein